MRNTLLLLLLAAAIPSLQGCFPVVAGGAGAGVLMAEDRRTAGTYVEDQGIELKAASRLDDKFKDKAHLSVTSYNRSVLMTGEAPTEAMKQEAETVVRGVPNVRQVMNEVTIAAPTSFTSRSNDALITSKVKARFLEVGKFQANYVKVVTENGVVYLLGLVTHREADNAVEIARTTGGVQKVVKIFEYLD